MKSFLFGKLFLYSYLITKIDYHGTFLQKKRRNRER